VTARELKRLVPRKLGILAAITSILLFAVGTALAIHDDGVFQLDGNAEVSNTTGDLAGGGTFTTSGDDWDLITDGPSDPSNNDGALVSTFISDPLSHTTDLIFTGGSTKDDLGINGETGSAGWKHTTGSVPDKDNIEHAFAAAYGICPDSSLGGGPAGDPDALANDFCIYFGLDRFARNGDAQVGFWFLQEEVAPITSGPDAGKFSGQHQVGDILILSDFTNGGVVGTIKVYKWDPANADTNGTLLLLDAEGACGTTGPAHVSCGESNRSLKTSPWLYDAKSINGTDNDFPQGSFYEGGVNLTALGLGETCVSSFIAETRSSQAVDAVLKDFAFGSFHLCDANIQIAQDGVNRVGDDHTVTVTVNAIQNGVSAPAPDGTTVSITKVSGPGTLSAPTCDTTGGTCQVTLTSNATGTTVVHAEADVVVGDATLHVETDGTGENSGDLTKIWVDARISIDPDDVNRVGQSHTFTVLVEGDTGSGFGAVDDEAVTVNLSGDADSVVDTCANGTGDAGDSEATGQCFVTFTSDTPGTVTGSASATVTLSTSEGDKDLPVSTGDSNSPTGSAIKRFVDAWISIDPDDVNRVGQNHTFTVTVEADTGSGPTLVDVSAVTVGLAGDDDNTDDDCANGTGDAGDTIAETTGLCYVSFTSDTPGTVTGSASATVHLSTAQGDIDVSVSTGDANSPTGSAIKRFVDARISISPSEVNRVNESHTFTVLVEANDGSGWAAVDDEGVTVSLTDSPQSVVDTCVDGTGDVGDGEAAGQCFVTFTSDTPTVVTGSASATVGLSTAQGDIDLPVSSTDQNSPTGDAIKRFVDARISIDPDDTNSIGELHTFTVLVEANDGSGWAAFDDEAVTVNLTGDADSVVDTCANGTGDVGDSEPTGTCYVSFTSDTAGDVVGSASANVHLSTAQGDIDLPVSTGDMNSPTGSATKTFKAGTLRWHKVDGNGDPLGGATFLVCRTDQLDSSTDPDEYDDEPGDDGVCDSVTDNLGLDEDPADGEFYMSGLILGSYKVKETDPPAGYHIGNPDFVSAGSHSLDPEDLDLEIVEPFVNLRAFRLIVIGCDDITDLLVESEVWLDLNGDTVIDPGEVKTTIVDLPQHLLDLLVTEQDICGTEDGGSDAIPDDGIGGATYGALAPNTYSSTMLIPL